MHREMPAAVLMDDIAFLPDIGRLEAAAAGQGDRARLRELASEASALGRPKALYRLAFVEERGEDWVRIGGFRFCSRVLRINLERAEKVYAYLATCGRELAEWAESLSDPLERYWADSFMEEALHNAVHALEERLGRLLPGRTASMNPGSLADWPLTEQRPLFALLEAAEELAGIRLTESCLMLPIKSVSGLRFPTEEDFENCQLCPRRGCPRRRAPHDPEMFARRYSGLDKTAVEAKDSLPNRQEIDASEKN